MSTSTDDRRQQVLAAIAAAGPAGISGERLAQKLGCSRAAVHRHVEALRRDGLDVVGAHEGYVLAQGADPVAPALISPRLMGTLGTPLEWVSTTGSTNDDVAAKARDGHAEGLVIGADLQTAGRGRRGRTWESQRRMGLTFSVLLRPRISPVDAALLPLVVAVAVAEAIGPGARISWPNDIVLDGTKVCGILCESSADESGIAWMVAGIGINVHGAPHLPGSRWRAGALGGAVAVSRADLLVNVLNRLDVRYREWLEHGPGDLCTAYAERDALIGCGLAVQTAQGEVVGTAAGIDEFGRLRVRTASGERRLGSGEVVRVERQ